MVYSVEGFPYVQQPPVSLVMQVIMEIMYPITRQHIYIFFVTINNHTATDKHINRVHFDFQLSLNSCQIQLATWAIKWYYNHKEPVSQPTIRLSCDWQYLNHR